MSEEQFWGADTVVLGKRERQEPPRVERARRKPSVRIPSRRALAELGAAALIAIFVLATSGHGERQRSREIVVKRVERPAAEALADVGDRAGRTRQGPRGQRGRTGTSRGRGVRRARHEKAHEKPAAVPRSQPSPVAEAPAPPPEVEASYPEPAPVPVEVPAPAPPTVPAPAPPAPTPPGAEFGIE